MDVGVQTLSGPPSSHNAIVPVIVRRSANFHPSIWGDYFLAYPSSDQTVTHADTDEQYELLKEEVTKMLLAAANDPHQQLKLIDDIQRLGVSYHFESEIDAALHHMNNIFGEHVCTTKDDDLHNVALCFRLLRQHGHNVSSDVFTKFKDSNGKFKESLTKDAQGLLSLYEATHVRVHGEDILEEALAFTTSHLERLKAHLTNPLADQVVHALKMPICKGLSRVEARRLMSAYGEDDSHNSKVLLKFAKLDFNLLQKLHQGELSYISRWWKDLNFRERLPFARDRVVECYFWILGVYYEPQYLLARRILTKVIAMSSIVDDIYDVYGTLDELVLFTDAIQRWDISALDQLPEYLKICYQALLDVYNEIEENMAKAEQPLYRVDYAKDVLKQLAREYLAEAKWFNQGYVPTIEEYLRVALITAGFVLLGTTSFVGMGNLATKEAFDWVSNNPLIIRAASMVCRLTDDMVGHEFEQERGHVASAVECYMKQHGASKQETCAEFKKKIMDAWKDMNKECLRPTAVAMPLLTRIVNLVRVLNLLYVDEDGYTMSKTNTKEYITSVLIDPVPI